MARPNQPQVPVGVQVSQGTFHCLIVMIFVLCLCNISLVFWAVEKDLVLSVASNVHLKSGAQRVVEALKDKVKGRKTREEEAEEFLTVEQAIGKYSNWHTTYYKAFTSSHISFFRAGISRSAVCSELTSSSGSR